MKIEELIGHKIMYDGGNCVIDYEEIQLIELSPSKMRVKVKYANGYDKWRDINTNMLHSMEDKNIIEDLGLINKSEKPKKVKEDKIEYDLSAAPSSKLREMLENVECQAVKEHVKVGIVVFYNDGFPYSPNRVIKGTVNTVCVLPNDRGVVFYRDDEF